MRELTGSGAKLQGAMGRGRGQVESARRDRSTGDRDRLFGSEKVVQRYPAWPRRSHPSPHRRPGALRFPSLPPFDFPSLSRPPPDPQPPNHDEATAEKKVDKPATSNLLTLFLYCHGSPELLAQRIAARKGHFMGARMLESQLATLQDPRGEEGVAWVDIDGTEEVVRERAVKNTQRLIAAELDEKDE